MKGMVCRSLEVNSLDTWHSFPPDPSSVSKLGSHLPQSLGFFFSEPPSLRKMLRKCFFCFAQRPIEASSPMARETQMDRCSTSFKWTDGIFTCRRHREDSRARFQRCHPDVPSRPTSDGPKEHPM